MKKLFLNFQNNFLSTAALLGLLFNLSSCAMIGVNTLFEENAQFKKTITPTKNKAATPVTVATEFNALVSEGAYQLPVVGGARTIASTMPGMPVPAGTQITQIFCNGGGPNVVNSTDATSVEFQNGVKVVTLSPAVPASERSISSVTSTPKGFKPHKAKSPADPDTRTNAYKVKPGDTLMKISFEHYGDIYKWRQILQDNKNLISNYKSLEPGTVLTVRGEQFVVIERNGKPYLIRKNETLTKISKNLYGSKQYWKSLWDNNRQLIKDPNKIYAGFTLYYLDLDQQVRPVLTQKVQPPKLQEAKAQSANQPAVPTLESTSQTDRVPAQNR